MHIGKRKEIYERQHPETKNGATGKGRAKQLRQNGKANERFTADTAKKTCKSERSIERDATRAKRVEVLPDVVGTSLDKGTELDALAKLPAEQQRALADRAKAGEKVSARNCTKMLQLKSASAARTDRFDAPSSLHHKASPFRLTLRSALRVVRQRKSLKIQLPNFCRTALGSAKFPAVRLST